MYFKLLGKVEICSVVALKIGFKKLVMEKSELCRMIKISNQSINYNTYPRFKFWTNLVKAINCFCSSKCFKVKAVERRNKLSSSAVTITIFYPNVWVGGSGKNITSLRRMYNLWK